MSMPHDNPFEVLRLGPTASAEEVVRQAGRLRQRAPDEAAVAAIRQAVQALTGRPEDRALLELLTHPGPRYEAPALEQFLAACRRLPPVDAPSHVPADWGLDEFRALLEPPGTGVREALWRCLLFDPQA